MPSPGEDVQAWSTTAATNSNSDTLINWAEGQPRASVNNSARSMMAAHAKDRDLHNGSKVTVGTINAQSFTSGVSYTAPIPTGLRVSLKIGLTNTGAATLEIDGTGPVAIKTETGADLTAGQLTAGYYNEFIYDGTNWILLGSTLTAPVVTGGITTDTELITNTLTIKNPSTVTHVFLSGWPSLGPSGFYGAMSISFGGDGLQYGIVMLAMQDNTRYLHFSNGVDVYVGSIENQFGVQVAYITASDENLKTDIEDLSSGNVIDRLRPVKFRWKARPDIGFYSGFLAQDVYNVVPQAVMPGRDDKPWGMDFSKLVPMLVAELKALRARVAALEAK